MTQTPDTITRAEEIIERFGGIRPMSTKTNIPVTTIQGWKKRGSIPMARAGDLLAAARRHDVKLEDLVGKTGAPANQNAGEAKAAPVRAEDKPAPIAPETMHVAPQYVPQTPPPSSFRPVSEHETIKTAMVAERRNVLVQSLVISAVSVVAVIGTGVALLWPEFQETKRAMQENSQSLAALEQDVGAVKTEIEETQSMFSGYLPGDWQEQIDTLSAQAARAQASVEQAMTKAQEISSDVAAGNMAAIEGYAADFGVQLSSLTNAPYLQGLFGKFAAASATPEGEAMLDNSVQELNAILQTAPPDAPAEQSLEAARAQSTTLGQAFEGVPAEDMKAAAMLLGFSQLRSALGRDNQNFEGDVALLKNLLGKDNPALAEAVDRLAPQAAQSGVLTPGGLATELQAMTGDIVVASLKGEDVSVAEKAQARFGEILKVEKDGEMLTGTPVQQKLAKAETLTQNGQLEQAIAELSNLEGPAAQMIQPWLAKARSTLQAQNLSQLLEGGVVEALSGAATGGLPGGGQLVEDPASGVVLYRRATQFAPPQSFTTP